ncbi:MAG TPA: PepSY domain-containing protein [Nitrosospira sp.]|nr:PepSY domain-containing protein [Nitrosospira sp.]
MKTSILSALFFSIAVVLATPAFADEKVQWSDVPAAVQKTITENADGGKIEEIEKETKTINGKKTPIYEAEVRKKDGSKIEIKVGEDGKLIAVEKD